MKNNVHIPKLHRKGITSVNILAAKVNFQKISLLLAWRLLIAAVLPSCSNRLSTTSSSTDVLAKVIAYFWKKWVGISKFPSNSKLIHNLYEEDFLEIQKSKQEEDQSLCFTRMASITKFAQVETATETLRRHFAFVNSVDNI